VLRTTTTSVSASPNPSTFGQTVNLIGTVSATGATGVVQIMDGSAVIGTTTVSGGNFAFATSTLAACVHSLKAAYLGDSLYASSNSAATSETVNKEAAAATLSSSLNPSAVGNAVTFTAHVSPSAASGGVSFYDGSTLLGVGTLAGGSAPFTTSSLAKGTHSIKAVYGGDANVNGATSAVLSQTVKQK